MTDINKIVTTLSDLSTGLYSDDPTRHGRDPKDGSATKHFFFRRTSIHQTFDIYLPEELCKLRAADIFVERITELVEGATIYKGAEGVWCDEPEPVRVLRISVEVVDENGNQKSDTNQLREAVRDAATNLLTDLFGNGHSEETIFFNDWIGFGTVVTRRDSQRVQV